MEKPALTQKVVYNFNGKEFSDDDVVGYLVHENYLRKLENTLIGDFDSSGKYIIADELLKNFVALKKTIVSKQENIMKLTANCSKCNFNFIVEIGSASKQISWAELKLVEKFVSIKGNEPVEIISTIANYKDDNDAFFEAKVKKIFNIVLLDESNGKENEVILTALLEKIKLMNETYEKYLQLSKTQNKIYIEKILNILKLDEQNGTILIKNFEALIKKYEKVLNPQKNDYFRILKQLLDEVLLNGEKTLTKQVADMTKKMRIAYNQANDKSIETVKTPVVKTEKKEIKIKLGSGPGAMSFKSSSSQNTKSSKPKEKYSSIYVEMSNKTQNTNEKKEKTEPILDDFLINRMVKYFKPNVSSNEKTQKDDFELN